MPYTKTVWSTGDTITATLANHWEQGIKDAHNSIDNHTADTTNPHSVTAAQAGALPIKGGEMQGGIGMGGHAFTKFRVASGLKSGSGNAGEWVRVGEVELGAQYLSSSNLIHITNTGNAAGNNDFAQVSLGVKQQNPLGQEPGVSLEVISRGGSWTPEHFMASLVYKGTDQTRVGLYVQIPYNYDSIEFFILSTGYFAPDNNFTPQLTAPSNWKEWACANYAPRITSGTTTPSGGSDGDVYIQY